MDTIDLRSADAHFRDEIAEWPGVGNFSMCFTCRTCTASCPVREVDARFDPLRGIRLALYGLRDELLTSDFIWLCTGCYTCQERCPQGVRITDFLIALKNMAVKAGHMPSGIRAQRDLVMGEGKIYPLDDFDNKKRKKAGLPQLPTSCAGIRELFSPSA